MIHKIKVSARPDRHEKRWGKVVMSGHPTRFRLDGRNWPNTIKIKGCFKQRNHIKYFNSITLAEIV